MLDNLPKMTVVNMTANNWSFHLFVYHVIADPSNREYDINKTSLVAMKKMMEEHYVFL